MPVSLAPSQTTAQTALRSFLLSILPAGIEIVEGQDNKVGEPPEGDYIVMTAMRRERLATNTDTFVDCQFTAAIAGTTMTVSAVQFGTIGIGNTLFGVNVAAGSVVVSQQSGPAGGAGLYTVSPSQTLASEKMATGVGDYFIPIDVVFQLDVHSANTSDSADMAQTIATMLRDAYANQYFFENGFTGVSPLYADDPKQVPFENAEQQYETRWIVEAHIQVNAVVVAPQQFADTLKPTLIEIDAAYPAT